MICKQNCILLSLKKYMVKKNYIFFPRAQWTVKTEWSRDFDRNIKLVSGRVWEWCLLVLTFPCVYDPFISHVAVAAAVAATNF